MLTLMQIELLLHYYWSAKEHPYLADEWDGCRTALGELVDRGFLVGIERTEYGATYKATDKAAVLAEAIRNLPMPVQTWAMPQ